MVQFEVLDAAGDAVRERVAAADLLKPGVEGPGSGGRGDRRNRSR
jgi:hypothetical protein